MGKSAHRFVMPLFEGPVDIIGDVHGEIDALRALLSHLGYELPRGLHPDKRKLVFVGDLVDRGPDSTAVVDLVRDLCERGAAQCVLGNHELNLLRGDSKSGNRWFLDPSHPEQQPGAEFGHSAPVAPTRSSDMLEFLASLPVALQGSDLRVVHATWDDLHLERLKPLDGMATTDAFQHFEDLIHRQGQESGLAERAATEIATWGVALEDRHSPVPLLPALAEWDSLRQMGNPLRVMTSGVERAAARSFFSSGKWRMCDRVPWWNEYQSDPAVVVGHYWRQWRPVAASAHAASKPDLFQGTGPLEWLGPRRNIYCVDFSVGARYEERRRGAHQFDTTLVALRLPERELFIEQEGLRPSGLSPVPVS